MTLSQTSDIDLIIGCQTGSSKSQEQLYKKFYGYAMSISLRYATSKEEASEILNDAFLRVFQSVHRFDTDKPFKPWLSRIVVNTAISRFRKEKKHLHQADIERANHHSSLDESALDKLSAEEIIDCLQELPELYRITFNMYELEGYSHKEIASELGLSESSSRSNLSRAKSKLQTILKKHQIYEYSKI